MYCPGCGTHNDDNNFRCIQCGHMLQGGAAPMAGAQYGVGPAIGHVPNYLVPSILVTIGCCLPLGIAAIVFASQVNGKLAAGDIDGALDASRKARTFCWIAFGLGLVVIAVQVFISVAAFMDARDRAEDARREYQYERYDD